MIPPLPTAGTQSHAYLRPRCGLCAVFVKPGERFVALIGETDSSAPLYRTQSLSFTDHSQFVDDVYLCRSYPCNYCESLTECVPIHSDCLGVFLQNGHQHDAWNRLWIMAAWQTPWQTPWIGSEHPQFHLEPEDVSTSSSAVAQILGFPKLNLLPSEIIQAIRLHSIDSPLWRLRTAQRLALTASQDDFKGSASIQLSEIVSWARGREPITAKASPQLPIVRFTLDAFGIQRIERLSSYSDYTNEQSSSDSRVFAFIDQRFIEYRHNNLEEDDDSEDATQSDAVICFQLGRARFQFKNRLSYPWLWNTPSPAIKTISIHPGTLITSEEQPEDAIVIYEATPKTPLDGPLTHPLLSPFGSFYERLSETATASLRPSEYRLHMYTIMVDMCTMQFRTISLDRVTGLTFFYTPYKMYGIHGHTVEEPSAVQTLKRLPRNLQDRLIWVYVPIPPGERILVSRYVVSSKLSFYVLSLTLQIRMRLAGDMVIGRSQSHHDEEHSILESPPAALVFREGLFNHATYFGVVVRNDSTADRIATICSPRTASPLASSILSTAPLNGVTRVDVYASQYTGLCVGILLHYQNGAQMTLDMLKTHNGRRLSLRGK
ncbi:hypothetical protein FGRMN_9985 [Fusarium graminum]|nr:hypothetical protein FGRMN_9985 [Fusarium graminum]